MIRKGSVSFLLLLLCVALLLPACSCTFSDSKNDPSVPTGEDETESDLFTVPKLSCNWNDAVLLYNLPESDFSGDYTFFMDNNGTYHLIGMDYFEENDKNFYHASGYITKTMSCSGRIYSNGSGALSDTLNMWSPCVVYNKKGDCAYLFYHYQSEYGESQIRIMVSSDDSLKTWKPVNYKGLKDGCIAFSGDSARDPYVLYDSSLGLYLMYYSANGIMVRTSSDLINWSLPKTILSSDNRNQFIESPCVIIKNNKYYLFAGSADYGRTAVYCSDSYCSFSDFGLLGEINGHNFKVFYDGKNYYALSSQINAWNKRDIYRRNASREYTLSGVYIQKLLWVTEDKAEWIKFNNTVPIDGKDIVLINDKADYYWSFDGEISEAHGLGKKITPDATRFTDGVSGQALICGRDYYKTNIYNLKLSSSFTISFYMKMNGNNGSYNVLFSKNPKEPGHFEVYVDMDGHISFYHYDIDIIDTEVYVADNVWHHCAFTYDCETLNCYIDGSLVSTDSHNNVPTDNSEHQFTIGCLYEHTDPIFYYNGLLDELKIFNKVVDSVCYN